MELAGATLWYKAGAADKKPVLKVARRSGELAMTRDQYLAITIYSNMFLKRSFVAVSRIGNR